MVAMDMILPRLYLGSLFASRDLSLLQRNNISHILVVGVELKQHYPQNFSYHHVSIDDEEGELIISHFKECISFIEEALRDSEGNILIHCAAGVSRSSTVVIAYLMYKHKWTFEYAMDHVKHARPCVFPNEGFRKQLELFENMGHKFDSEHPDFVQFIEAINQKCPELKEYKENRCKRKRLNFNLSYN